ncbi:MAG: DUF5683 domain-containing protein [Ekhidna sp.]
MKKLIVFVSVWTVSFALFSQEVEDKPILLDDSTFIKTAEDAVLFEEVSDLDPQRAALLSAIVPGLGQVYNGHYWKVPIVVTGLIVFGHFINYNNKVYHSLRNAAIISRASNEYPYNTIIGSTESLVRNRDNFRRNRDFLIVLGSAFYILQIVDAHVSAHLEEFSVNEALSLQIKPSIEPTPLFSQAIGLSLVLKF